MGARLGQHFLRRGDVARRIVDAAGLGPGDAVVEIGPGRGILTREILAAGAVVTAVEYDERLHADIAERFQGEPRLSLVRSDFLGLDLSVLPRPCRVVANLPYSVAVPILQRILRWSGWDRAVLMFQKEVAERILAGPGSRKYGILSVAVALHARAEPVCGVPKDCFAPRPKVDSAVVRLLREDRPPPFGLTEEALMRVVKAAFGQRRKAAVNALSRVLGLPRSLCEGALAAAGAKPLARAETLSLDAFAAVAARLIGSR